jgi:hypothetical protein
MNAECQKEYSMIFLSKNFSDNFVHKIYHKHLEDIYFKQEQSILAETQTKIMLKDKHIARYEEIRQNILTARIMMNQATKSDNKELKSDLRAELSRLYKLDYTYDLLARHLMWLTEDPPLHILNTEDPIEVISYYKLSSTHNKQHQYVARCPSNTCNGFVGKDMTCGTCNIVVCHECHQQVETGMSHTCDPNDIATSKMLKNETKPCPKCTVSIYKIDGCDQMWCVECHTAFSWTTGKVETKIHNPHYFEWLRKNKKDEELLRLNREANQIEDETYQFRYIHQLLSGRFYTKISNFKPDDIMTDKYSRLLNKYIMSTAAGLIHYRHEQNELALQRLDLELETHRERFVKKEMKESKFKSNLYRIKNEKSIIREQNTIMIGHINEMLQWLNELYEMNISTITEELYEQLFSKIFHIFQKTEMELQQLSNAYKTIPTVFKHEVDRFILSSVKNPKPLKERLNACML